MLKPVPLLCGQAAPIRVQMSFWPCAFTNAVGDQGGFLVLMVCPFFVVVAAQRGFVGTLGTRGKAGRSKAALHRASGAELQGPPILSGPWPGRGTEASGLERHARAGVIPTTEAVLCGTTRKEHTEHSHLAGVGRPRRSRDADRKLNATSGKGWTQALP